MSVGTILRVGDDIMNSMQIKGTLREGKPVIGTMFTHLHSPAACRVAQQCGFDFLIFDTEHSRPGVETLSWIFQTARDIDYTAIVRDPGFEGQWPTRYLDLGASGNLFPRVETPEEAEDLIRMVKYPPEGERGWGTGGPHDDYGEQISPEYPQQANEANIVICQIETKRGWEARDEIFSVPGIDATFIGPNDLSLSLGHPRDFEHPEVTGAMDDIFESAAAHGVAPGMHCFDVQSTLEWLSRGALFMAYSSDIGLLRDAATGGLQEIRDRM